MSVEDRVRAATRATADTVREIRPLDLPEESPLRLPRIRLARRWAMWMAPVTAAAVVAAIALALASVRDARNEPAAPPAPSAVSGTGAFPEYYAALDDPAGTAFDGSGPGRNPGTLNLVVGDTRTGKRLVTFNPPKGQTFGGVTGAADDRTFVVGAWQFPAPPGIYTSNPAAWYLLRIAPGSRHPATLTRLSIPGQPTGTAVSGIALSPNGRELAVMFQRGTWFKGPTGPLTLQIYSIPSGRTVRTWAADTKGFPAGFGWYWGRYSNSSVTWPADGHTLAFAYGILGGANGPPLGGVFSGVTLRTLNLTRPGHDLLADSKVVFSLKAAKIPRCDTLQLTADGRTALCGTQADTRTAYPASVPEFIEYSLATSKPRVVYRVKGTWALALADVLWASPDGATLIGSVYETTTPPAYGNGTPHLNAGVIAKGTFKPLRFPLHDGPPFAGEIAF
jgi:hypothetical protein